MMIYLQMAGSYTGGKTNMPISLLSYAMADIKAAQSALKAVKNKEGNEKAAKGIAA